MTKQKKYHQMTSEKKGMKNTQKAFLWNYCDYTKKNNHCWYYISSNLVDGGKEK